MRSSSVPTATLYRSGFKCSHFSISADHVSRATRSGAIIRTLLTTNKSNIKLWIAVRVVIVLPSPMSRKSAAIGCSSIKRTHISDNHVVPSLFTSQMIFSMSSKCPRRKPKTESPQKSVPGTLQVVWAFAGCFHFHESDSAAGHQYDADLERHAVPGDVNFQHTPPFCFTAFVSFSSMIFSRIDSPVFRENGRS